MLKEQESFLNRLLILVDLILVGVAFFVGHFVRNKLAGIVQVESFHRLFPISAYLELLPYILVLWYFSFFVVGAYQSFRARSILHILFDVFKGTVVATILFGSLAYSMQLTYVSRTLVTAVSFFTWLFISTERIFVISLLDHLRRKGYFTRYVLVVGTGSRAQAYIQMLHAHPEWGLKIRGLLDDDPDLVGKHIETHEVIGTLYDMRSILEKEVIDEVAFVVPRSWLGSIEDSILIAELLGKRVSIAIDLFNLKFAKPVQRKLDNFPLLTFEIAPYRITQLFIKRLLDIILSIIGIIMTLPITALAVFLIKSGSKGPIIFKQERSGLNGRRFTVYKFRTMVVGAEEQLEELRQHNEMSGPAFKMKNDPRIIRFGKFMRTFSIDELPQLFNVLQGDMSFVGPRPPIPAEVEKYKPWQRRRLSMRPGLTCIWQVKGRSGIVAFDEWMQLDLEYIDEWTLWLDLKLFFQTIPIVIFGIGAK